MGDRRRGASAFAISGVAVAGAARGSAPSGVRADGSSRIASRAQFRDFSDADKLFQAAYTSQNSGVEVAASGCSYTTGTAITRNVRYDLTAIDTEIGYVKPSVARNAFSATKLYNALR